MQEFSLTERFADSRLIGELTVGELWQGGLITILLGVGILFLIWGVIAFILRNTGRADEKANVPDRTTGAAGTAPAAETVAFKPAATAVSADAEQEFVAVLMAAIAAFQGDEAAGKLRIRKIRRIPCNRAPWNAAGVAECIESRKF